YNNKIIIGWRGPQCNLPCWAGHGNADCKPCNCKNDAGCDPLTGECICTPGWTGKSCEKPCSKNFYGINCSQECQCKNGAVCDPVNGECICAEGWIGSDCSVSCPSGEKKDCLGSCPCVHGTCAGGFEKCDCQPGYTGHICDKGSLS
ncbi:unnamed protein product, partial [Onchocerca flexuosa]|uniref:EGF-like domain-containing protein n=1 Tax=Onchocerca flexuosa TaxID=387005 RepID=A0A183HWG9_9BILA